MYLNSLSVLLIIDVFDKIDSGRIKFDKLIAYSDECQFKNKTKHFLII